ncbi:hypothetical protein EWM64_g1001 [Hericium alpestre]|uniref:Uncharacterized protein n=1 Tax=Hericium alpestre TaxID=135208 RepID=A0A4Z0ABN2_9AGAM|nr:hypothetical protein EWM64_g1001 [Hericium alpestre]
MEVQPSPSSPRSFTIPKPENGLAEWTQKIKALQRQVDADDEEEHRRLEQEIAASRLARVRRSAGFSSRLGTVDLPNIDDVNPVSEQAASSEDQFASNRQTDRADAMQKLTKPESISLAAFMGGRATGPRLNRHAAQQDAHDPTQFEQRDSKSISAPHPVFGRGGVAMPGLAAKGRIPPASVEHSTPTRVPRSEHASDVGSVHSGYGSDREGKRERRISTSAALRRYQEHVGQQAVPPQKTGGGGRETPRVRTFSIPTGAAPVRTTPPLQSAMKPSVSRPITPTSSPPEAHASTAPVHSNGSAPFPTAPALVKPTPPSASFTPRQTTISLTSRPSSITTPSLARPIQPAPKSPAFIPQAPAAQLPSLARPIQPVPKSPSFPQVPPSKVPSPAFLRTPLQKEPTPSISRLKGRGFVQSMVKASSQLEASVTSSPTVSEMGRPAPAKRLTSVAERWTPTPSPPPTAAKTLKPRKSFSSEPAGPPASNGSPRPSEPVHTGKSLKKAPSVPALKAQHTGGTEASKAMSNTEASPSSGPALGSSSTMISYIRPVKTGDDPTISAPPVRSRPTTPAPDVDELGVRESVVKETRFAPSELPSPSGKPLSHLTKGRAKKPRKAKGATVTFKDTVEVGPRANVDTSVRREDLPPLKPASRPLPRVPPPSLTVSKETSPAGVATCVQSMDGPSSSPMPLPAAAPARRETSKAGVISDRWTDQPVIGVKAVGKSPSPSASAQRTSETKGKENEQLRGRALPALAAADKTEVKKVEQPRSPRRMSRIPSTGNRATVMDVAQVMHAQVSSATSASPSSSPKDERTELSALRETSTVVNSSSPMAAGKSSDRRSPKALLPCLKEEKIPVSSPAAGTRSQGVILSVPGTSAMRDKVSAELPTSKTEENDKIKINHVDDPIPTFNVGKLLEFRTPLFTPDLGTKTVSVDVMSIVASTAAVVTQGSNVFHESEVLAIIHRFKAKSSGLVATRVWGWHGKHSQLGEHEDRKLKDLARHYNTTLILVPQCCEPAELVHVLGFTLTLEPG